MIIIVDYGMGNLRSILKVFQKLDVKALVSSQPGDLEKASKIILPGVGHFAMGMKNLREYGLIDVLNRLALIEKKPILGICLGMQLLTRKSEEGMVDGLGWIDAETERFSLGDHIKLRVPHMGWNSLEKKKESILLEDLNPEDLFYFVHSYHVKCQKTEDILTTTNYGITFVSTIEKENIFGTQFHPEKSHKSGIKLLKNFITM